MDEQPKTLRDMLDALARHRIKALLAMGVVLAITLALTFGLPSTYRSTATILIEQQEMPADLVQSAVTTYADQRIQLVSQRVMTYRNLLQLIEKYGLYRQERRLYPAEVIVERMRGDIALEMVSADVVDPRSGRPVQATIAFTLSYESESPQLARDVANELTSLILDENLKVRREKAEATVAFLAAEAARLEAEVAELEDALADFKERNAGSLPEMAEVNVATIQRTERDLDAVRARIATLEERRVLLEAAIARVDPQEPALRRTEEALASPRKRLALLRTRLISLQGSYSDIHPDVVRVEREIRVLEEDLGVAGPEPATERELERLRGELAQARERYAPDHPDVKWLERVVAALEDSVREAEPEPIVPPGVDLELASLQHQLNVALRTYPPDHPEVQWLQEIIDALEADVDTRVERSPQARLQAEYEAENPAYVQLKVQLRTTDTELTHRYRRARELEARMAEVERRLMAAPGVEREYRGLLRDYENALSAYQQIRARQREAEVARALETDNQGERLTLIEPPLRPEEPHSPNRLAIFFLGAVLTVGTGVATVSVAETLDSSLTGPAGVAAAAGVAPLGVIPAIVTAEERRRRRQRGWLVLAAALFSVLVGLVMVHLFVERLDVLWFRFLALW